MDIFNGLKNYVLTGRKQLQITSAEFTALLASYGVQLVEKTRVDNEITEARYTIPEFYDEKVFNGPLEKMDEIVRSTVASILTINRSIIEYPFIDKNMCEELYEHFYNNTDIEIKVRKGERWTEANSVESVEIYLESVKDKLGIEVIGNE